jgi:hypothetical protein
LAPVYVFRDLEYSVLEDIANFSTKRHFFEGEDLISEHRGALSDFYVLKSSAVAPGIVTGGPFERHRQLVETDSLE